MKLRITKIIRENHETRTLYFEDADEGGRAFDYIAGQYITFRFDDLTRKPIARSYTLSSSPCEENQLAVTVKGLHGGIVSQYLCEGAKVGDILRARGPMGKFCYFADKDAPHLAMIAAGSGVTPFTSMLREYSSRLGSAEAPQKMTLLVSYRSQNDLINWDLLQKVAQIEGVRILTTLSREDARDQGFYHGRIREELLEEIFCAFPKHTLQNTTFMTCGPQEMMDLVVSFLRKHEVPEARIKVESYESD